MRFIRLFPVLFSLILPVMLLWAPVEAAQKKATSTAKKTTAKKSTTQAKAGSKSSKTKKTASSSKRRKSSSKRAAKSRGPQRPEPERIREIQTALASRGYDVEPNGVWDSRSVEAVKRFQNDNEIKNLTGKGKLDSLTLIALGLGPKHDPQAEKPKTNPEGQQP